MNESIMTKERRDKILSYLIKKYPRISGPEITMIEKMLMMMQNYVFARDNARTILSYLLHQHGVTPQELDKLAKGEVPVQKIAVPVYACYNLGVKVWVEVPQDATDAEIKEAAIEKILLEGDYEADEGLDQEPEDIHIYEIDHDGAQHVDE